MRFQYFYYCFICVLFLASCDKDDNDNITDNLDGYDRSAMLYNWSDNIIIPAYNNLYDDLLELNGVIEDFSKRCFVPIAAGGGVRSKKDVDRYLSLGADKVVLNTQAINNPSFITDVAKSYGSQSVVVSIDVKNTQKNEYKVLKDLGKTETILNPELWAYKAQELGAGEIMITSIDRDGSLLGYDIEIAKRVSDKVDIPVLISGGAGNWDHLVEGIIKGGASAVCITNIYHFTETAISSAKKYMHNQGIPVRL